MGPWARAGPGDPLRPAAEPPPGRHGLTVTGTVTVPACLSLWPGTRAAAGPAPAPATQGDSDSDSDSESDWCLPSHAGDPQRRQAEPRPRWSGARPATRTRAGPDRCPPRILDFLLFVLPLKLLLPHNDLLHLEPCSVLEISQSFHPDIPRSGLW